MRSLSGYLLAPEVLPTPLQLRAHSVLWDYIYSSAVCSSPAGLTPVRTGAEFSAQRKFTPKWIQKERVKSEGTRNEVTVTLSRLGAVSRVS